ncbi:MAG TPA: hypothetical protein VJZ32_00240 [Candidatus Bathyarchaeia archaeon]|nr:hypothetical protein [Candidatus Bathyarchaeia archaeon]
MRRTILTIGLLLTLAGVFVMNQGVQILTPVATVFGMASYVQVENPVITSTLVTIQPTNYSYLSANLDGNVQVSGTIQVEAGQEIGFYVMDEGNLSLWKLGQPANILLAKPSTISSNFTLTPPTTGTYFFVFDNPDQNGRVIVFNASSVRNVPVLPPFIQYAPYELLLVGIPLIILGLKTGKKSRSKKSVAKKCRFCGGKIQIDQTFCPKCKRSQS